MEIKSNWESHPKMLLHDRSGGDSDNVDEDHIKVRDKKVEPFFRYTKMFSTGVLSDIQISLKIYFHKEPRTISATVSQAEQI